MRYHQLREVFKYLYKLKMATLDYYERSLKVTKQERTRMVLHYLIDKQKTRNEHLMDSFLDDHDKILEIWFDDEIDPRLLIFIEKLEPDPDASSDKLLSVLIQINEKIEDWLNAVLLSVSNKHGEEYIQSVIDYLHHTNQQILHAVHRMDDV